MVPNARSQRVPLQRSQWLPMRLELRLSRLPHSRAVDAEVLAGGHRRQAGGEILQIDQGVFAVELARDDQA